MNRLTCYQMIGSIVTALELPEDETFLWLQSKTNEQLSCIWRVCSLTSQSVSDVICSKCDSGNPCSCRIVFLFVCYCSTWSFWKRELAHKKMCYFAIYCKTRVKGLHGAWALMIWFICRLSTDLLTSHFGTWFVQPFALTTVCAILSIIAPFLAPAPTAYDKVQTFAGSKIRRTDELGCAVFVLVNIVRMRCFHFLIQFKEKVIVESQRENCQYSCNLYARHMHRLPLFQVHLDPPDMFSRTRHRW
jgi:hypothetical protein